VTTAVKLRWYQEEPIDALIEHVSNNDTSPCIELPTGSGKSPTMAGLIHRVQTNWEGVRVLVLAHVQELVQQNHDKLKEFWPSADAGIYSAGLNRRDKENATVFASIQSVRNRALELGTFDFILIDEAHRIPLKGDGAYRTFINQMRKINPNTRVAGFTATPFRLQGGAVCGPKNILNEIIYRVDVLTLVNQGFLCRPVTKNSVTKGDVSGVSKRNGDFVESELDSVLSEYGLVRRAMAEFVSLAHDRKHWILFGAGTKHIEAMQKCLREDHDIDLPIITGNTPKAERARLISEFKAGKHRGLLNINVLSEGFDAPMVDCVGMFRPTESAGLYYQQVGRGFRLYPGKENFLVLDFADNVIRHGPVDAIKPPPTKMSKKASAAPVKICKECRSMNAPAARQCAECGCEFPLPSGDGIDVKHGVTANDVSLLSDGAASWHAVSSWSIVPHHKPGKPPSLRITYLLGIQSISEWVLLEHGSFARAKAIQWWTDRGGQKPAPRTVEEAINRKAELVMPVRIAAIWSGKYPSIVSYSYQS
jgi:DNA repair protein RadD